MDQQGVTTVSRTEAAFSAERLRAANINPETLLATDYLNHFNEAVMAFELALDMPEMAEEIAFWAPKTYVEHFAASPFREKDLAVAAYHRASRAVRADLDAVVAELDAAIRDGQRLVLDGDRADPRFVHELEHLIVARLKPLVGLAMGVIGGRVATGAGDDTGGDSAAQAAVDELFA